MGYAVGNAISLLPGFSCCRKQFLPQTQALEEGNKHRIFFSKELEQKKPSPRFPIAPTRMDPLGLVAVKGGKKGGVGVRDVSRW